MPQRSLLSRKRHIVANTGLRDTRRDDSQFEEFLRQGDGGTDWPEPRRPRPLHGGQHHRTPTRGPGRSAPRAHCPEDPEKKLIASPITKGCRRTLEEQRSHTSAPMIGGDVERVDLVARGVVVTRRSPRDEARQEFVLHGEEGPGRTRIVVEAVSPRRLRSVYRIEQLVRDQPPIANLPRPHVHPRHRERVIRRRLSQGRRGPR